MFKRFAWYLDIAWTVGLGFPIALISLKYDLFIVAEYSFKNNINMGPVVVAIIVYFLLFLRIS